MIEKFVTLSRGNKIPRIGLGTSKCSLSDFEKALEYALQIGYRHIDTAFQYKNEEVIGNVLKRWIGSGKLRREDLFITTKLSLKALKPDDIEKNLKESLKNLQLDYLNLYLIHFPSATVTDENSETNYKTDEMDHIAMWKKMEEQVDNGLTKSIGLSNFNKEQVQKILASNPKYKPDNLQIELHVYLQQIDLVKFCLKHGISVTGYGPLGSPGYNSFLKQRGFQPKPHLMDILKDETVKNIAGKHAKLPSQIALRFLLQMGIIIIPKSITITRLKENFEIFDFTLDEDDMKKLRSLEVGEIARRFTFSEFPGVEENPEYPFKEYIDLKLKSGMLH